MNANLPDLPPELGDKFLSFLREVNGQFEVADMRGLCRFILEHGEQYPALFNFIELNEEVVVENFKRSGEVPPGVKLIQTSTREGDNVTELRVFHGPLPPKS